jgi:hypothetical protein
MNKEKRLAEPKAQVDEALKKKNRPRFGPDPTDQGNPVEVESLRSRRLAAGLEEKQNLFQLRWLYLDPDLLVGVPSHRC